MTNHTPGPWTPHEKGAHPYLFVCGPSEPTEHGEESFLVAYATGINAEANARLIAAAPDLLNALQIVSELFQLGDTDIVRNALAKATGPSVME